MSDWTLDGAGVIAATLAIPSTGPWVLDAETDTEEAPAGAVDLVVGEVTWRGAVAFGAVFEGRWKGRVVGGAGGLGVVVPARFYRSVPARLVVAGILSDAGEALAPDAPGLDTILGAWTRRAEIAARALSRLAPAWRALPDGTLTTAAWPSTEVPLASPSAPEMPSLVDAGPLSETFALEALDVLPGMTRDGRVVADVTYALDGASMRAEATYRD